MEKLDLKRVQKELYTPSHRAPSVVEVPEMSYLMADGAGDPNTAPAYKETVAALFAAAYTLKFMLKRAVALDFAVMPLEGQWWVEEGTPFSYDERSNWRWTLMIRQPDAVTPQMVDDALYEALKKGKLSEGVAVRFRTLHEGRAAQIMHLGPYSEEPPTIEKLHAFIEGQGGTLTGRHHEIYLSDARKTAPEKLRTIIRQPFI